MLIMTSCLRELDMWSFWNRFLVKARSARFSSFTRIGVRICTIIPVLFLILHVLWIRSYNMTAEDPYEAMRHNRDVRKYVSPGKKTTLWGPVPPDCNSALELLILVPSAPGNIAKRQAIRDTWGKTVPEPETRLLFLLGHDGQYLRIKGSILEEAKKYNDIIVEDFVDTYENLTLKTVFMLKWTLLYCNSVPFILKTDDDMLVNTKRLLQELKNFNPAESVIIGKIQIGAMPYRDKSSKWYLPNWLYEPTKLPNFASGTSYVISRSAVPLIYSKALDTPLIPLEDVFLTGLVAHQKLGVKLVSLDGVHNSKPSFFHRCLYFPHITVHELEPDQLTQIWTEVSSMKSEDCDSFFIRILEKLFGIGNHSSSIKGDTVW